MATINDVARLVGVSATTVSKVLNGKGSISKKTTEQVQEAIRILEYRPSVVARTMVLKKTNIIGVLLEKLSDPFFYELINSIERGINNTPYKLLFCNSNGDSRKRLEYLQYLGQGIVDGIIVYGSYYTDDAGIESATKSGFPLVVIENNVGTSDVNNLVIDNQAGAKRVVDYLIENGHERIAHIVGKREIKIAHERLTGYLSTMTEHQCDIRAEYIVQSDMNYESGYISMLRLIELAERPTAVFCVDDATACGAIDAAVDRKLRVPEDISVVGFDDQRILPPMYRTRTSLTTMRQPLEIIGGNAVNVIIKSIENPNIKKVHEVYQCDLVVRESSRRND